MKTLNEIRQELLPVVLLLKESATYSDCPRCIGKGDIAAFRHVKGGICFKCNGSQKTAKNQAAKNYRKINWLFAQLRQSWKYGIKELESQRQYREIREVIEKLPKKYKQELGA